MWFIIGPIALFDQCSKPYLVEKGLVVVIVGFFFFFFLDAKINVETCDVHDLTTFKSCNSSLSLIHNGLLTCYCAGGDVDPNSHICLCP